WSSSRQWRDDAENADAAAELEELGYRALWLGGASGDLGLVQSLLGATKRMALASGVVNIWASSPDAVAAVVEGINGEHPDRFLLGIGAGHARTAEAVGQTYERPYEKMVGYLDVLEAASPPVSRDQMVLAALGPRVVRLAGDRTAGAHPYLVPPEHT